MTSEASNVTVLPAASPLATRPDTIPPHVWELLQEAGEEAASRLVSLLKSPRFASYKPSEQRSLIDLALTRAYGLPVRREVSLNLSSSDTDAVAASIAALGDALTLPERQRARHQPSNSEKKGSP